MHFADSPILPEQMTIGDWIVRPRENLMTQANGAIHIAPKAMDLLVYLALKKGHVVSKAEFAPTYNLIVADFHTYFVGSSLVLCHDNTHSQPTNVMVPGLREY